MRAGPVQVVLLVLALASVGCRQAPTPTESVDSSLLLANTLPAQELCENLQRAAVSGRLEMAPRMVDHLDADDAGVRACAYSALIELTGQDPVGYRAYDPPHVRAEKIRAWRAALEAE